MKNEIPILYEDNHLLVVLKPAGMLSQGDETGDLDLLNYLKGMIKVRDKKPGNVYLGLVHRLDRPTGGVMVFAKTSKAAKRLSEEIRNHLFSKKYYAIVLGHLPLKDDTFEDYMIKDGVRSIMTTKEKGKKALLSYHVLEEKEGLSLVDVTLFTGRHHQIRLSFAHRRFPLYGDYRYGKEEGEELGLFAYELSFHHPVTKELLTFKACPVGTIWDLFGGYYD